MPLETATYISDLNVANPAHTDGLSQADSHMRLLKSVLKAQFPNFTAAALTSTQAQIDGTVAGTAIHRIPLGTAALPGLTPVGDPDTGIWSNGANLMNFSAGGVSQLQLSTAGATVTNVVSVGAVVATGAFSGGTGQLVPIGGTLIWWDDVLPTEGGYAWANGQIIASANTVCPVLLARWGTRFGGNGTTTMGVPDLRDTAPIGKSTMGGVASRALHTLTNTVLGALIGVANQALIAANIPPITSSGSNSILVNGGSAANIPITTGGIGNDDVGIVGAGASNVPYAGSQTWGSMPNTMSGTNTITVTSGGAGTAVNNVQPSTTCNYIIRLA